MYNKMYRKGLETFYSEAAITIVDKSCSASNDSEQEAEMYNEKGQESQNVPIPEIAMDNKSYAESNINSQHVIEENAQNAILHTQNDDSVKSKNDRFCQIMCDDKDDTYYINKEVESEALVCNVLEERNITSCQTYPAEDITSQEDTKSSIFTKDNTPDIIVDTKQNESVKKSDNGMQSSYKKNPIGEPEKILPNPVLREATDSASSEFITISEWTEEEETNMKKDNSVNPISFALDIEHLGTQISAESSSFKNSNSECNNLEIAYRRMKSQIRGEPMLRETTSRPLPLEETTTSSQCNSTISEGNFRRINF